MSSQTDILEDEIFKRAPSLLNALLKDQTCSRLRDSANIIWATQDYKELGEGYQFHDQIQPELITGENGHVIMPRILKDKNQVVSRVRDRAEVFTPSWVCNYQNNQIDEIWFGRKGTFNKEVVTPSGERGWKTNKEKILFPTGKRWRDYINDLRIEVSCGEAPYLASRYDLTNGNIIPVEVRIGIIDRKLRIVSENANTESEWINAAFDAFKSTYGYEWQGDSLLIARESMLFSFIEHFQFRFGKMPDLEDISYIAYIISWNLWQMDGIKGVIPDSCHDVVYSSPVLFGDSQTEICPCEGCEKNEIQSHNGIYCYIMDWHPDGYSGKGKEKAIRFIDILR